jgi:hypothetical protein
VSNRSKCTWPILRKGFTWPSSFTPIAGDAYFFVNDVLLPEWTEPVFALVFGSKPDALAKEYYRHNCGTIEVEPGPLSNDFYSNNCGKAEVKMEHVD